LAGGRRIARDDQSTLDGVPEGIARPAGHGGGGLADRGDPHAPGSGLEPSERLAYAATAVDLLQGRLQQAEQQLAAWIAGVRRLAPAYYGELAAVLTARVFGGIGALQLQALQIFGGDITGDVFT
jgi:hypothetical protein